jgi:TonB family protein
MAENGSRKRSRLGLAMLGSALLHGAALAFFWVSASRAAELPKMRIYSVNIVSPPPQEAGEPTPATPAPEPTPAPPQPKPSPPPKPTTEAALKPAPVKESRPTPPKETKPVPPKETKPAPPKEAKPEPPREKPAPAEAKKASPPDAAKSAPKEAAPKRTEAPAEPSKPAPSRGANPSASSAGGEDLNVRITGMEFTDPAYLENIIRQVRRYFRPPAGSRTDVAEVIFWINRDGSVGDIEVGRSSGSFQFRAAAMEAVEQAGLNKAFGPLPKSYPADRLPVSFEFKPAR